jgi:hypothetical protein
MHHDPHVPCPHVWERVTQLIGGRLWISKQPFASTLNTILCEVQLGGEEKEFVPHAVMSSREVINQWLSVEYYLGRIRWKSLDHLQLDVTLSNPGLTFHSKTPQPLALRYRQLRILSKLYSDVLEEQGMVMCPTVTHMCELLQLDSMNRVPVDPDSIGIRFSREHSWHRASNGLGSHPDSKRQWLENERPYTQSLAWTETRTKTLNCNAIQLSRARMFKRPPFHDNQVEKAVKMSRAADFGVLSSRVVAPA